MGRPGAAPRHGRTACRWTIRTGCTSWSRGPCRTRFVGFDPETEEFFASTAIASGGGTVRHMYYHAPAREIWFGTDTNNIGRARVP